MEIINKKTKPKTSKVYDTYWNFIAKRQDVFYKRFAKIEYPWTDDSILNNYKFTNVYRATDRVSQYLIKVISKNYFQHF